MSEHQIVLTNTAGISSVASFWMFAVSNGWEKSRKFFTKCGVILMTLGFFALTAAIFVRGLDAQRFPLANLYESLLWFAWAIMGGFVLLIRSYPVNQMGLLAALVAASMFLYGSWLPSSQHEITPLVPALMSYWRQIHVPPLIVSYAAFFLSGLAALMCLHFGGQTRSFIATLVTVISAAAAVWLGTFTDTSVVYLQLLFVGSSVSGMFASWRMLQSRTSDSVNEKMVLLCDEISYRCISIGMPLLTIGIVTGALWANHAWGSYWSWDPKESMALVTWLGYAVYIHLRNFRQLNNSSELALVAVCGLLLTLLTYLGFNSLGFGGLHSYGQFK